MEKIRTYKHSGGLGDLVCGLPAIMVLGKGDLWLSTDIMTELLEIQPYINRVYRFKGTKERWKTFPVDYNLDEFRKVGIRDGLVKSYLTAFDIQFDMTQPWLFDIEPNPVAPIIINDTGRIRYLGYSVDWKKLKPHESKCAFIGYKEQYEEFVENRNLNIPHHIIKNGLEYAQAIKGSKLFIGNQSWGITLAEALKHPRVVDLYEGRPFYLQGPDGYTELTYEILDRYL